MSLDVIRYPQKAFELLLSFIPNFITSNTKRYFNMLWWGGQGFWRVTVQNDVHLISALLQLRLANLQALENCLTLFRIYKKLLDHSYSMSRETTVSFGQIRALPSPADLANALEDLNNANLLTQANFTTMSKVYERIQSFSWLYYLTHFNLLTLENFNAVTANAKPDDLALALRKIEGLNLLTIERKNTIITSEDPLAKIPFILATYLNNLHPKVLSESWNYVLRETEILKNIKLGRKSLWNLCDEINDTQSENIAGNASLLFLEEKSKEVNSMKFPYFGSLFMRNLKRGKALNLALDILARRNTKDHLLFPKKNQGFKENFWMFNVFKYLENADLNNVVKASSLLVNTSLITTTDDEDKNQETAALNEMYYKKSACTIM